MNEPLEGMFIKSLDKAGRDPRRITNREEKQTMNHVMAHGPNSLLDTYCEQTISLPLGLKNQLHRNRKAETGIHTNLYKKPLSELAE